MANKTFKADISRLMHMIVHSFYKNKEIFLRELVSNSSDAIDKARFINLKNNVNDVNYEIRVSVDASNKTITIEDNGIGMDEKDLEDNLSTIAHSGTLDFQQQNDLKGDMIGQFGVGFYSAYLVSDYVEVITRKLGSEHTYNWQSDAKSEYQIMETESNLKHGTRMILHLRESESEFLDNSRIKEIIKQHSSYITYPINLYEATTKPVEEEAEVSEEEVEDADETPKVEEVDMETQVEPKPEEPKTETVYEWKQVNNTKPIWYQKPSELTSENYASFYKALTNDWEEPLTYKHFEAEGQLEFKGILFVPKRPPFDMFSQRDNKRNIKLYAKKVFIMDDCRDIVPEWMSFVSGVIDSSDLPLNVSREMLQQNSVIKQIKKHLTKQVVELLGELSEDAEKYKTFYDAFSKNLKLAVYEDEKNQEKLLKLLRFHSSLATVRVSLEEYAKEMKEGQKNIYFLAGENLAAVKSSVFLDKLKKKEYPVLFLIDAIDEFVIQKVRKYQDYEFVDLSKASFDEENKVDEEEFKPLIEACTEQLKGKVDKVKLSVSLVELPSCIVTEGFGWSSNMERIMKAQTMGDDRNSTYMKSKKVLELNPNHDLVIKMKSLLHEDRKEELQRLVDVVADVSLLTSGFTLENPEQFAKNVYQLV